MKSSLSGNSKFERRQKAKDLRDFENLEGLFNPSSIIQPSSFYSAERGATKAAIEFGFSKCATRLRREEKEQTCFRKSELASLAEN
jgi:hypothetical protein